MTNTEKKLARLIIVIIAVIAYAPFALAVEPPVCSSPGNPPGCKPAKPSNDGIRGTK